MKMGNKILLIESRIHALAARDPVRNARIIKKLQRKLRKLKNLNIL